jgi:hypothetical protein
MLKRIYLVFLALSGYFLVAGYFSLAYAQMASPASNLNPDVLFNLVNEHRAKASLSAFVKHDNVCSIAISRAPELEREIFVTRNMHAGFNKRNIPFWMTENMIHMRTEMEALQWWLNSYIHRSAIMGNYQYACTACQGNNCAMIFTNFEPKILL